MSKRIRVTVGDCSYAILVRIAKRCGFHIIEARKHCKIKTPEGGFVTTIPRHNRLKRETAKVIIEAFVSFGAPVDYF